MGDNTISNLRGKGSPATYWRRRFFALLIGLSIFGVLAWAVSGAIEAPKPIRAAGNVTAGGVHGTGTGAGTSGPAGGGSGRSGGTGAAASPSPPATASPVPSSPVPSSPVPSSPVPSSPVPGSQAGAGTGSPGNGTASGGQGSQGGQGRHQGKKPPAAAGGGGPAPGAGGPRAPRCATRHIVISLVVGKPTYPAHANPQFTINVVSTAKQTCIFDVGAAHLALVIRTVAGRVWSSADCVQGRKSLMSDLAPGVPTAIPVTWNRTASRPGCKADPGRAGAGVYAATAEGSGLTSKEAIFRIR